MYTAHLPWQARTSSVWFRGYGMSASCHSKASTAPYKGTASTPLTQHQSYPHCPLPRNSAATLWLEKRPHSVAQASPDVTWWRSRVILNSVILLLQLPQHWDYGFELLFLTSFYLLGGIFFWKGTPIFIILVVWVSTFRILLGLWSLGFSCLSNFQYLGFIVFMIVLRF